MIIKLNSASAIDFYLNMKSSYNKFCPFVIKIVQNTAKYCSKTLNLVGGEHILLAVSGGPDSLAMVRIFKELATKFNFTLSALSINHQTRDEAEEDAFYAQKICNDLDIPCSIESFNAKALSRKRNIGLEEASRIGRYQILKDQMQKLHADFIALGHQNHDLSEDILMRLIRGCGWPALGGMKARDDKRHLIRPLLWANPDDLKRFLAELGMTWRDDSSNNCLLFLRNRIRKNILPEMRKENPSLEEATCHIHELAQLDSDYWENEIRNYKNNKCWSENLLNNQIIIDFPKHFLKDLHQAFRLRLYLYAIRRISSGNAHLGTGQANFKTIIKLDRALLESNARKTFQFGKNIFAELNSKNIIFYNALS